MCGCADKSLTAAEREEKLPATGETWTVMLYVSGGSDESGAGTASKALAELTRVKYPENISVLVQTGGTYEWKAGGIDTNYLDRFEAQKGGLFLMERQELAGMGSTRTLADYIEWSAETRPADHYALIIYGAGAGSAYGAAHDETAYNDCLNVQRIAAAISDADINFEIIGFDAGLSASLETAAALSTCAEYIVASQESMASGGWSYRKWLEYIIDNPTCSVLDVAKAACDTYAEKCKNEFTSDMATMSVIDTENISALSQSFDGMAGEMTAALDSVEDYSYLSSAAAKAMCFGANTEDEGYSNMVDLKSLVTLTDRLTGNTGAQVSESLNECVVYNVCGKYRAGASGMSVYYPLRQDSSELEKYIGITPNGRYSDFLRGICANAQVSGGGVYEDGDYRETEAFRQYEEEKEKMQYSTVAGTTGFELNMIGDMDIVRGVEQRLFKKREDGICVYLGNAEELDENKEAGIYKTKNVFRAASLNGHYLQLQKVCGGDGYTIYSSPVKVDGTAYNMRLVKTERNGRDRLELLGLYKSLGGANAASRVRSRIRIYNRVTALMRDYASGELIEADVFKTWPFGARLRYGALEDGNYKTDFIVSYIYGNSFLTGSAEFSAAEGTIAYR